MGGWVGVLEGDKGARIRPRHFVGWWSGKMLRFCHAHSFATAVCAAAIHHGGCNACANPALARLSSVDGALRHAAAVLRAGWAGAFAGSRQSMGPAMAVQLAERLYSCAQVTLLACIHAGEIAHL